MKTIDSKTFLHALLIAIVTPILTGLVASINQGSLPTIHQLEMLGLTGLGAGITYILKNLFVGSGMPTVKQAAPIIILFMLLAGSHSANAQANSLQQMPGTKWLSAGDTIINTGTAADTFLFSNAFATGSI